MRKLLNKPWFAAVLALSAIALVASVVFSGRQSSDAGVFAPAEVAVASETPVDTAAKPPTAAALKALPIPPVLHDPFTVRIKAVEVHKVSEPDAVDTVHLSAIWTQDGQTLVLINDKIYQGGDEIGRFKIESATPDGVWITHWKGRDFLSIGGNFTLNTPAEQLAVASRSL